MFKLNTRGLATILFVSWIGLMLTSLIVNEMFYGSEIEMERPANIDRNSEMEVIDVEDEDE